MSINGRAAAPPSDDYEWDAFISYKHEPELMGWIDKVIRRLQLWVSNELGGRHARIFFDTDSIDNGTRWPDRLRHAIRTSRCLVPILSPAYFQCRWCVTEWDSFIAREKLVSPSVALIVPMKYHDGDWLPPEAQEIQTLDLQDHCGTTDGFWRTASAHELDLKLRKFAHDVARAILEAPPSRPDWPIAERERDGQPTAVPWIRL